ncbi:hypothetical protein DFQ04_1126 [Algoriphagus boseongensis]|uniref:Porin-like protein n=1 Tax=Algoriphagus boseongensis TaxID=1442587 RepID=A0A4R6TC79_9BACT|nr:DcaP family trimeric outer membrane transporter [Algoriphagus boseongensis]TDQ19305.1 hypothetical protein DFQ04_1126 [Algoriphagus boseongensis]
MKNLTAQKFLALLICMIFNSYAFCQVQDSVSRDSINLQQRIIPAGDIREASPLLTGYDLVNDAFPGSWPMFGTNLRMKVGGYFKADFIGDLDGTLDKTQFLMSTIPVEGTPEFGNNGYIHFMSQETRFNIDVRRTDGKVPLKLFIEGDFFSSTNQFRLRHAYLVAGDFIIGQTWTTLSFLESLPFMIDFAAGDALFGGRTTQIRYQKTINSNLKISAALEMLPFLGIENPDQLPGKATLQAPLFAIRSDYSWQTGLLLMGTSIAQLHWDGGDSGPSDSDVQFDVIVAGRQYLGKNNYFTWNVTYGNGSGENIMAFAGSNANAVLRSDGKLETMPAFAFVGGYMHKWSEKLSSNLAYAYGWLDPPPSRDPYSLKKGGVGHVNLIWHPITHLSSGIEYMWGAQRTTNDALGKAGRIQAMVKFDF